MVETSGDLAQLPQDHQHYGVLKGLVIDNVRVVPLLHALGDMRSIVFSRSLGKNWATQCLWVLSSWYA